MTTQEGKEMVHGRTGRGRARTGLWIAAGITVVAVAAWVGWIALAPEPAADAEDVITTFVGKPAPILRFPDADGRVYTVPERGRPTVLIFHMGFF